MDLIDLTKDRRASCRGLAVMILRGLAGVGLRIELYPEILDLAGVFWEDSPTGSDLRPTY